MQKAKVKILKIIAILIAATIVFTVQVFAAVQLVLVNLPLLKTIFSTVDVVITALPAYVEGLVGVVITALPAYGQSTVIALGQIATITWGDVITQLIILMIAFFFLVLLSLLAFGRPNRLLFLLVAGLSMIVAANWYSVYMEPVGLTISMVMIAYAFISFGFAMKCLLWKELRQ